MSWIDWTVVISAYLNLAVGCLAAMATPFLHGRKKEPYNAMDSFICVARLPVLIIIVGRLLGWW